MASIKYDNQRDQFENGFDAGLIVDGNVIWDQNLRRFVIVDDDNVGFDVQAALQRLVGKKVRVTMISFDSIIAMEDLLKNSKEKPEN